MSFLPEMVAAAYLSFSVSVRTSVALAIIVASHCFVLRASLLQNHLIIPEVLAALRSWAWWNKSCTTRRVGIALGTEAMSPAHWMNSNQARSNESAFTFSSIQSW